MSAKWDRSIAGKEWRRNYMKELKNKNRKKMSSQLCKMNKAQYKNTTYEVIEGKRYLIYG